MREFIRKEVTELTQRKHIRRKLIALLSAVVLTVGTFATTVGATGGFDFPPG